MAAICRFLLFAAALSCAHAILVGSTLCLTNTMILALPAQPPGQPPRPPCTPLHTATLAQWKDAAEKLTQKQPLEAPTARDEKEKLLSYTSFTAEAFADLNEAFVLAEFTRATGPSGPVPSTQTTAAEQVSFLQYQYAFVGRAQLPLGAQLAVFGDMHGSFLSLVRFLETLVAQPHACFDGPTMTLTGSCYMLFCGDLVDRGPHGPETFGLIMALRLRNPDRVFVLRGNHESVSQNKGQGSAVYEAQLEAFLPTAFFISTVGAPADARWAGFMHGGIELGVSVRAFLAAPLVAAPSIAGQPPATLSTLHAVIGAPNGLVPPLDSVGWRNRLEAGLKTRFDSAYEGYQNAARQANDRPLNRAADFGSNTEKRAAWLRNLPANSRANLEGFSPAMWSFTEESDIDTGVNQFRWGDFSDAAEDLVSGVAHNRLKLGRELTQSWLAANNVVTLFRGHQHNGKYLSAMQFGDNKHLLELGTGTVDSWAAHLVTTIVSAGQLFSREKHEPRIVVPQALRGTATMDRGIPAAPPGFQPGTPDAFVILKFGEAQQPASAGPTSWRLTLCSGRPTVGANVRRDENLPLAVRELPLATRNLLAIRCTPAEGWRASEHIAPWVPTFHLPHGCPDCRVDDAAKSDQSSNKGFTRGMNVRRLQITTSYSENDTPASSPADSIFAPPLFLEWYEKVAPLQGRGPLAYDEARGMKQRRILLRSGDAYVPDQAQGARCSDLLPAAGGGAPAAPQPLRVFHGSVADRISDGCAGAVARALFNADHCYCIFIYEEDARSVFFKDVKVQDILEGNFATTYRPWANELRERTFRELAPNYNDARAVATAYAKASQVKIHVGFNARTGKPPKIEIMRVYLPPLAGTPEGSLHPFIQQLRAFTSSVPGEDAPRASATESSPRASLRQSLVDWHAAQQAAVPQQAAPGLPQQQPQQQAAPGALQPQALQAQQP